MKRIARVLAIVVAFLTQNFSHAEDIVWNQTVLLLDLNPQWKIFTEFQPRWIGGLKNTQLVIMRGAFLYQWSESARVGIGAGSVPQFLPTLRNEFRIFEQVDWSHALSEPVQFQSRTRLEQRMLENADSTSWRVRQKAQLNWKPSAWGAYVWDELFWNFNEVTRNVRSGFDQNRLSFGPRYQKDSITFELGFLSQGVRNYADVIIWNSGVVSSLTIRFM